MGLKFTSLADWQRWQSSRRRPQRAWAWLRGNRYRDRISESASALDWPTGITFWQRGAEPTLLVALDSLSPSSWAALLVPLLQPTDQTTPQRTAFRRRADNLITDTGPSSQVNGPGAHLSRAIPSNEDDSGGLSVVIAAPAGLTLDLPPEFHPQSRADLDSVRQVVSIGDHLPVGRWAHAQAVRRGWQQVVIQHGILTPFSPPPPADAVFLAWSQGDADFISQDRPDLEIEVAGSTLLQLASRQRLSNVSPSTTPVFLGQLHGAELSTADMARTVTKFWRQTGAHYLPHPAETNLLSRLQHRCWQRRGMTIRTPGTALRDLAAPVVSIFSTGILEAAALGLPSWGYHHSPPDWVSEVWDRYQISRWGTPPSVIDESLLAKTPTEQIAATWFDGMR